MSFFEKIFHIENSEILDSEVWNANPLAIVDANEAIVFAKAIKVGVSFVDNATWNFETLGDNGPPHMLTNAKIFMAPEAFQAEALMPYGRLQRGNRGGSVYEGFDQYGMPAYWYFNSAADSLILVRHTQSDKTQA